MTTDALLEQNRETAKAFMNMVFNEKKTVEALARYAGPTYIQHNPYIPDIPDSKEGLIAVTTGLWKQFPQIHCAIQRVVADGDLVVVHSKVTFFPGHRGRAVADILRLEDGKIVEHWDVQQDIPETPVNDNTMF